MIKKIVLAFAITFSSATIYAETNKTSVNSTKNESNLEIAYKLLDEMNLEKMYDNAVNQSTKRLIAANSGFKPIEDKIKGFYSKYIGWKSMKKDLAKLYMKYYTKEELIDLTNFYKTKTGKKVLATMTKLSQEGQKLTQDKIKPHIGELKKILDEQMKKTIKKDKEESKKEEKK